MALTYDDKETIWRPRSDVWVTYGVPFSASGLVKFRCLVSLDTSIHASIRVSHPRVYYGLVPLGGDNCISCVYNLLPC